MTERLGAWKNAPLAYVLAEVRTEQLADLKNYQAELAAAFRSDFPIQRALVTARIIATTAGAPSVEADQDSAWEFATPDNRVGLILRPYGFVLHATRYRDHSEFLGQFQDALNVIAGKIPSVYVNRLGLRYVDFILPRKGETPENYVDSRLSPELDLGKIGGPITAMSLTVYPMPSGRLTHRFFLNPTLGLAGCLRNGRAQYRGHAAHRHSRHRSCTRFFNSRDLGAQPRAQGISRHARRDLGNIQRACDY